MFNFYTYEQNKQKAEGDIQMKMRCPPGSKNPFLAEGETLKIKPSKSNSPNKSSNPMMENDKRKSKITTMNDLKE